MKKSPAFQFYPNDWLSSPTTQIMTAEQEGAYIRLLCFCWQDEDTSLKDDDDYLAALARISKGGLRVVKAAFNQHPTKQGYLTHNRLQKEREVQSKWREKSADGGRKSAESKRLSKGGSRVVQPKVNSSSSSSSSIEEKKERVSNDTLKKKVSLEDLSVNHISEWLAEKRMMGVYIAHDEHFILEQFKDYCLSKGKKYADYIAGYRNAFQWERCQPKQNYRGNNDRIDAVREASRIALERML